jgi:hypothetical protein
MFGFASAFISLTHNVDLIFSTCAHGAPEIHSARSPRADCCAGDRSLVPRAITCDPALIIFAAVFLFCSLGVVRLGESMVKSRDLREATAR